MANIDLKSSIQSSIKLFANGDISENTLALFSTLGYNTDRQNPFIKKTYQTFKDSFLDGETSFNEDKARVNEWRSVDLLFQLTKDEMTAQQSLFDTKQVDQTMIETYLFFAIELTKVEYSRTAIAQITREVNKVFSMPVMLVFKHGGGITISVINRRINKRDKDEDVLKKVTLIKDISIENPHRAHIEILFDLSFDELQPIHNFTNFVELHNAWQKTLDTKELNKRFYRELSNWYFWAMQEVTFPGASLEADHSGVFKQEERIREHNAKNLIRLLTRILFVWFIKEKNLIPEALFDESYIRSNLIDGFEPRKKRGRDYKTQGSKYYRAILQNLFFATLNQTMGRREFRRDGQHMNVTNLMRYEGYFKDAKAFVELLEDSVPFMNGGLFECLDKPDPELKGRRGGDVIIYEDGFSDRPDNELFVPDHIFFGTDEHADLSEELGNKRLRDVKEQGLINILRSYKFTVTENTPIEEDIALDPELLGQVFENLLASYNPETKITARKQTGSFYTPREIVNYMVDESIKAYLKQRLETEAGMEAEDAEIGLEFLVGYYDKENLFDENETAVLISAIDNCKILDPACGSGAFPMGILHKLVHILHKLDPDNGKWREVQRQKAIKETEDVFEIGNKQEREDRLKEINDVFENNSDDYGRKLYLIENCIYGVDIQPIATQISKLRFFISLIVDQKTDKTKDNFSIRPLPNLETKFVAANALISIEKTQKGDFAGSLFDNKVVNELEEKLKNIRHRLFSAKTPSTKRRLREEDKKLRERMGEILTDSGWDNETARQLAVWDPYDQNASSAFFDPEWMFGVSEGFDVVIGNPPYGIDFSAKQKELLKKKYEYLVQRIRNSFLYFTGIAFELLTNNGVFSFILPNEFLFQIYMEKARRYFLSNAEFKIAINTGEDIFDAIVPSCVILVQKNKSVNSSVKLKDLRGLGLSELDNELVTTNFPSIPSSELLGAPNAIFSFNQANSKLISKILRKSKPFEKYCDDVANGISTSCNQIYIVKRAFAEENKFEKEYLKPSIRGTHFNRYYCPDDSDEYVLYVTKNFKKADAPNIYSFLKDNKDLLIKKCVEKNKGNRDWHILFRPRDETLFKSPKIIIRQTGDRIIAAIDYNGNYYCINSVHIAKIENSQLSRTRFLIGLLNSQLFKFVYQEISQESGRVLAEVKPHRIKQMPIVETDDEILFEITVNYIIQEKKQNRENNDLSFFEFLIDAMVYELYFPEEIKSAGCEVLKYLTNIPKLKDGWSDEKKLAAIEKVYQELSAPTHPVSIAMEKLKTVPEVRIIEGLDK